MMTFDRTVIARSEATWQSSSTVATGLPRFARNNDGLIKDNLSAKAQADHRRLWRQAMRGAYDRVKEGLNEALGFAQGEKTVAIVHSIEVPSVDVAAIRATTGLSQSQFAKSIGVAKGTLLN
jgi:hypothetical protein